ncbi:MAG: hypothetical protein HOW73_44140 [Polyangiaceae bacterium]|nr:hypothetical protein [Polyangiaceae bacterium]
MGAAGCLNQRSLGTNDDEGGGGNDQGGAPASDGGASDEGGNGGEGPTSDPVSGASVYITVLSQNGDPAHDMDIWVSAVAGTSNAVEDATIQYGCDIVYPPGFSVLDIGDDTDVTVSSPGRDPIALVWDGIDEKFHATIDPPFEPGAVVSVQFSASGTLLPGETFESVVFERDTSGQWPLIYTPGSDIPITWDPGAPEADTFGWFYAVHYDGTDISPRTAQCFAPMDAGTTLVADSVMASIFALYDEEEAFRAANPDLALPDHAVAGFFAPTKRQVLDGSAGNKIVFNVHDARYSTNICRDSDSCQIGDEI